MDAQKIADAGPIEPSGPLWLRRAVQSIALAFALFHLYTAAFGLLTGLKQRIVHLTFVLVLIFLSSTLSSLKNRRWLGGIYVLLAAAAVYVLGTTYANEAMISDTSRVGLMTGGQILAGIVLVVVCLVAAGHVLGWVFPALVGISIVYMLYGGGLPRPFGHSGVSLSRGIELLYMSPEGIFGLALGVSSTYLVIFILFGGLMGVSGLNDFTFNLGKSLFRKSVGGSAKISVVGSGVVASVTGSDMANAASTGAVTIPLMIRNGYSRPFAAAVEAVASNGAQLVPPIMGTAAFLMAELVGVPYSTVLLAAAVPGALYYVLIYTTIHLRSKKRGLWPDKVADDAEARYRAVLRVVWKQGHLLLPIFVLLYAVAVLQLTIMRSALIAVASVVVTSWFRPETRMWLRRTSAGLVEGAMGAVGIGVATACVGMIMGVFGATGLGIRFSRILIALSGENLLVLLLITALASLLLGAGLPTLPNYIVLAILVAPALMELGVDRLAAHLFIFYFGQLAQVTPPVALAVVITSRIANTSFWATAGQAVRMSGAILLIPFVFVLNPAMIFRGEWTVFAVLATAVPTVIGLMVIAVGLEGFWTAPHRLRTRALLLVGGVTLVVAQGLVDIVGGLLILGGIVSVRLDERSARSAPGGTDHDTTDGTADGAGDGGLPAQRTSGETP